HHPPHRLLAEGAQVPPDLIRLAMGGTGVDHQQTVRGADDRDIDVVRLVSPEEDPVGDLQPTARRIA
ncbi:MAG: hypothetical protein H0V67_05920, partial [Geodermatophilaceae bacterium]|nr:hypothetical protein [Geodermatophilaceae bacterium]